ncbi:glycosyl transferase group 1 [Methylobacterium sp. 4-46]|uniref:glycosyltransferase family 4 protein n=1 Tax=unclassified Methylobacterium TaxID=2615210 RepID=UPI000165CCFA|nr:MULTISPECIES: glycosyltransferase family 4 protein [Methylobacterium]ACA20362.1 glycosyl transferase group 1 [Methylobacterium sp. 4-46]WFT79532.1 glycosyltransferase family 4 protein [Methylobacterium nodulans]
MTADHQLEAAPVSVRDGGPGRGEREARVSPAGAAAPPQVVQVIQEFSAAGGAETVAWELARTFARAGVPNHVIANRVAGRVEAGITVETVAPWLARIPTRGPLRHLGRLLVVPAFTLAASLALRRHRGAVVISHGDSLAGDILVVHAVNAASLQEKRQEGRWRWLLNPMHLWVALRDRLMITGGRYARYVAVSRRVRTELQVHHGVPARQIEVIPNGIDLARFRGDPEAGRAIRAEFGIPDEAKLLVFVGHEFARKGLAHAVGALRLLGPDYWLVVVGSDNPAPYRDLARPWSDHVIFAGSRSDAPAFYAAADALVLPSRYETFSLVCMEAMACSLPVFATAVGGIEDYLLEGVNGYFIKPLAHQIAATIGRVLSDAERVAALRAGARATAQDYGWDRIGQPYLALVRRIAAAKQARRGEGLPESAAPAGRGPS